MNPPENLAWDPYMCGAASVILRDLLAGEEQARDRAEAWLGEYERHHSRREAVAR